MTKATQFQSAASVTGINTAGKNAMPVLALPANKTADTTFCVIASVTFEQGFKLIGHDADPSPVKVYVDLLDKNLATFGWADATLWPPAVQIYPASQITVTVVGFVTVPRDPLGASYHVTVRARSEAGARTPLPSVIGGSNPKPTSAVGFSV